MKEQGILSVSLQLDEKKNLERKNSIFSLVAFLAQFVPIPLPDEMDTAEGVKTAAPSQGKAEHSFSLIF